MNTKPGAVEHGKHGKGEQEHLLEEYRANVELSKHDNLLRQQHTSNFLTINTRRSWRSGLGLSFVPAEPIAVALVAIFSVFGATMAATWVPVDCGMPSTSG